MEKEGKISVIMGIYNCASTLPEAIGSILSQTYTNWELILCDDASTDQTYQIAESFQRHYPDKIKLLRNEVNSKLAYTLNHCLKYASGEFIARMDGDDISSLDRFEKEVNYLRANSEVQLVGAAMQQFNDDQGKMRIIHKPEHPDRWTLHKQIPFHHATIMTYKYVYDALGGYTDSERTIRVEDYDLWFRFFAKGFQGANINEVLYFVREDLDAIKRRTFKARLNGFKTSVYGYKLLGYPRRWLINELYVMILKSIVPSKLVALYRRYRI